MTTEIPEIFRALLEHPFTLPNFDEYGKWLSSQSSVFSWSFESSYLQFRLKSLVLCKESVKCMQTTECLLRNPCHLSCMGMCGLQGSAPWLQSEYKGQQDAFRQLPSQAHSGKIQLLILLLQMFVLTLTDPNKRRKHMSAQYTGSMVCLHSDKPTCAPSRASLSWCIIVKQMLQVSFNTSWILAAFNRR